MSTTCIDQTSVSDDKFKSFRVTYTKDGKSLTDEAYLTITVGTDTEPPRQVIVLPDSGILLAMWTGEGPVDMMALRAVAIENVKFLTDKNELAKHVKVSA